MIQSDIDSNMTTFYYMLSKRLNIFSQLGRTQDAPTNPVLRERFNHRSKIWNAFIVKRISMDQFDENFLR